MPHIHSDDYGHLDLLVAISEMRGHEKVSHITPLDTLNRLVRIETDC